MFTPFSHKIYNPNIYNRCMLQWRSTWSRQVGSSQQG